MLKRGLQSIAAHAGCAPKTHFAARATAHGVWPPRADRPGMGRPGQRTLRRFSATTFMQVAWPQLARQFAKEVPEDFWSWETLGEVGIIACPCGAEPRVRPNSLTICEGEDCGRAFMLIGETVRVARYNPTDLSVSQL